jgi:hypothetical protein
MDAIYMYVCVHIRDTPTYSEWTPYTYICMYTYTADDELLCTCKYVQHSCSSTADVLHAAHAACCCQGWVLWPSAASRGAAHLPDGAPADSGARSLLLCIPLTSALWGMCSMTCMSPRSPASPAGLILLPKRSLIPSTPCKMGEQGCMRAS